MKEKAYIPSGFSTMNGRRSSFRTKTTKSAVAYHAISLGSLALSGMTFWFMLLFIVVFIDEKLKDLRQQLFRVLFYVKGRLAVCFFEKSDQKCVLI